MKIKINFDGFSAILTVYDTSTKIPYSRIKRTFSIRGRDHQGVRINVFRQIWGGGIFELKQLIGAKVKLRLSTNNRLVQGMRQTRLKIIFKIVTTFLRSEMHH